MSTTWLQEKEAVANNLGKTDGATFNTKREDALNRARRKYHSEHPWTFLKKNAATLTFTAQVASLPTDSNEAFAPQSIYKYIGNVKYEYRQVEWTDLAAYGQVDYVYALDKFNNQVKISQTDASLSIDYIYLPIDKTATDGTQDTDVEPAPDTTAIELLGTAYFYLSSRQSRSKYEAFLGDYRNQVKEDIKKDMNTDVPRFFRTPRTIATRGYQSLY